MPPAEAFGLPGRRHVYLVGGGGKTSLMFALARDLAGAGHTVLTTTSTRILHPSPEESPAVVVEPFSLELIERLRGVLRAHRHATAVPALVAAERKLVGFTAAELDALAGVGVADCLLVEADGAAGRPLKAHRDHEPVLSERADLVVVVIGVSCLGRPADDAHVHRAALFRERLGLAAGTLVTAAHVAAMVLHPEGYLRRVGRDSEVRVFLNQADGPREQTAAADLAAALRAADARGRVGAIIVGSVQAGVYHGYP